MTAFIISHPPEGTSNNNSAPTKGQKSKSDKKSKKNASPTNEKEGEEKSQTRIDNESPEADGFDDFDDQEFSSDAYAKRIHELCHEMNGGMYMKDSKESSKLFYMFAKEKKDANELNDANVQKELVKEAELLNIKDKAILYLAEIIFTENIFDEIKKHKILLLRFCNENKKAQKYLLGAYEKLVADVYKEKLFPHAVKILKQFYDEDIIDEETIIEWSGKESKKYISKEMSKKLHEKVAPLVKWLKEAEVEDSDESEEEVDEEEENKPAKNEANHDVGQQQRKQSLEDDEDDEDDIDLEFSHRVSGIQLIDVGKQHLPRAVNGESLPMKNAVYVKKDEEDIDIDNI